LTIGQFRGDFDGNRMLLINGFAEYPECGKSIYWDDFYAKVAERLYHEKLTSDDYLDGNNHCFAPYQTDQIN